MYTVLIICRELSKQPLENNVIAVLRISRQTKKTTDFIESKFRERLEVNFPDKGSTFCIKFSESPSHNVFHGQDILIWFEKKIFLKGQGILFEEIGVIPRD